MDETGLAEMINNLCRTAFCQLSDVFDTALSTVSRVMITGKEPEEPQRRLGFIRDFKVSMTLASLNREQWTWRRIMPESILLPSPLDHVGHKSIPMTFDRHLVTAKSQFY